MCLHPSDGTDTFLFSNTEMTHNPDCNPFATGASIWRVCCGTNRPDDLVHGRVGEEGLIQLVVAPLTVADQVQDDVFPEQPLVLHSQPSGPQHVLRLVAVYVDHGTVHHLPCAANGSIRAERDTRTWSSSTSSFQAHPTVSVRSTDRHHCSTKRIGLARTEWCNPLGCSQSGGCSHRLCSEGGLKASTFLEQPLGRGRRRHRGPVEKRTEVDRMLGGSRAGNPVRFPRRRMSSSCGPTSKHPNARFHFRLVVLRCARV